MHYILAILIFLAPALALGEETDVGLYLNTSLQSKPQVKYSRTRIVRRSNHCPPRSEVCQEYDYDEKVTEQVIDYARVVSTEVVAVKDLVFDKAKIVTLPEKALIQSVDYKNCEDVPLSVTASVSVSGSRGFSIQKSKTVSTTRGGSFTLSGAFEGGQASTTFNISESIGLSSSTSESYTTTDTRSISSTLTVGPKKYGTLELLSYETTLEIPFSAVVEVDGSLEPNAEGLTKANQLIGISERTIPFSGKLRVVGMSKGKVHPIPGKGPANCEIADKGIIIHDRSTSMPAKNLPKTRQQAFVPMSSLFNFDKKNKSSNQVELKFDDSVIGPPDGVEYEILSVSEIARPYPGCGFNDLGVPNIGVFSVEKRKYSNYSQGRLISSWIENVESFKSCWTP